MKKIIMEHKRSCRLVRSRIAAPKEALAALRKNGEKNKTEEFDPKQKITLSITGHRQAQENIMHLTFCMRRAEQRVKTSNLF